MPLPQLGGIFVASLRLAATPSPSHKRGRPDISFSVLWSGRGAGPASFGIAGKMSLPSWLPMMSTAIHVPESAMQVRLWDAPYGLSAAIYLIRVTVTVTNVTVLHRSIPLGMFPSARGSVSFVLAPVGE